MQRSVKWRSRRELSNAYFLAKIGLDTSENEPCQVCRTPRNAAAVTARTSPPTPRTRRRAARAPPGRAGGPPRKGRPSAARPGSPPVRPGGAGSPARPNSFAKKKKKDPHCETFLIFGNVFANFQRYLKEQFKNATINTTPLQIPGTLLDGLI